MKKFGIFLLGIIINITMLLFSTNVYATSFINPVSYEDTEKNRQKVIAYIEENTKDTYCETVDMCNPSTLRMMEKQNLKAFKYLITVDNKELLQKTIDEYCSLDMCNYETIKMMYNSYNKASKQKLSW